MRLSHMNVTQFACVCASSAFHIILFACLGVLACLYILCVVYTYAIPKIAIGIAHAHIVYINKASSVSYSN